MLVNTYSSTCSWRVPHLLSYLSVYALLKKEKKIRHFKGNYKLLGAKVYTSKVFLIFEEISSDVNYFFHPIDKNILF